MEGQLSPQFRIVIVGGGLAGLVAAVALRAANRKIIILEKSHEHKEIGAAISLQPNATKILEKWGLGELLLRRGGVPDKGFRIYSTDGELRTEIPFSREKFGADRMLYHRADLLDALKEAATSPDGAGPPVEIRLASKVIECDCDAGIVQLSGGTSVTTDLIIGADGIHSKMRQFVTGIAATAVQTGISAYRILMPSLALAGVPEVIKILDPSEAWTTMIMGYDRRVIMGPCRQGTLFSIVCLVPDEFMNEKSTIDSWTSEGSLDKLLETFSSFPEWVKDIFRASSSLGLWQLRDLDPLETWINGRAILIGDAGHAMLPTQGQGASQSIEDAEALQVMFADLKEGVPSKKCIMGRLAKTMACRLERVSLIQKFSRMQARPATSADGKALTMNTLEFESYNCSYEGAADWMVGQANPINEHSGY